jgi:hypothetical protein
LHIPKCEPLNSAFQAVNQTSHMKDKIKNPPISRVEWQAATLHPRDSSGRAWQLRVNGRVLLNAVAMTDMHEAVTADDRKLIGQAIAEYVTKTH